MTPDDNGDWEIRVEYPEAPYGVEFVVNVTHVAAGAKATFGFTSHVD